MDTISFTTVEIDGQKYLPVDDNLLNLIIQGVTSLLNKREYNRNKRREYYTPVPPELKKKPGRKPKLAPAITFPDGITRALVVESTASPPKQLSLNIARPHAIPPRTASQAPPITMPPMTAQISVPPINPTATVLPPPTPTFSYGASIFA
jgi:hypothetical protein